MFLSGLNEHFKTLGGKKVPKKAFQSKDDAMYAINNLINDKTAHVYQCKFCGKWHIGHLK